MHAQGMMPAMQPNQKGVQVIFSPVHSLPRFISSIR